MSGNTYSIGRIGLNARGAYDAAATYTQLDVVEYDGSSYVAKQSGSEIPVTNDAYWSLFAQGRPTQYSGNYMRIGSGVSVEGNVAIKGVVVPIVQSGRVAASYPASGGQRLTITFPRAFETTPNVVATADTNGVEWGTARYVHVLSVTTTQCVLWLRSSGAASGYVQWVAVGCAEEGTIGSPNATLENNSWGTIAAVSAAGNAGANWNVGDEKTLLLNGESYIAQIIGFGHDDLATTDAKYGSASYNGGSNKAGITFALKQVHSDTQGMNGSNSNAGGWNQSTMRSVRMSALFDDMEPMLRLVLRTVSKTTAQSATNLGSSADTLFLFSQKEVTGQNTNSLAGEGTRYAYWAAGNSAIKYLKSGTARGWWLRSLKVNSASDFMFLYGNGECNGNAAGESGGVVFGFCV